MGLSLYCGSRRLFGGIIIFKIIPWKKAEVWVNGVKSDTVVDVGYFVGGPKDKILKIKFVDRGMLLIYGRQEYAEWRDFPISFSVKMEHGIVSIPRNVTIRNCPHSCGKCYFKSRIYNPLVYVELVIRFCHYNNAGRDDPLKPLISLRLLIKNPKQEPILDEKTIKLIKEAKKWTNIKRKKGVQEFKDFDEVVESEDDVVQPA